MKDQYEYISELANIDEEINITKFEKEIK